MDLITPYDQGEILKKILYYSRDVEDNEALCIFYYAKFIYIYCKGIFFRYNERTVVLRVL